jgi:hypothetical protein
VQSAVCDPSRLSWKPPSVNAHSVLGLSAAGALSLSLCCSLL